MRDAEIGAQRQVLIDRLQPLGARILRTAEGDRPVFQQLLNDLPLLLCVGLWAVSVAIIIYGPTF